MRPHLNVVTLAVDDLDRSLAFYRDGLGLATDGIVGEEFVGSVELPAGRSAMFTLDGGLVLSLYPRTELAKDAHLETGRTAGSGFSLGYVVDTREEVDDLLAEVTRAGGEITAPPHERPWGIYSGYFADPDGHLWEVVCFSS
ncbi:MAG TPA: VOC family protein [Galbitalea sp.]|nr:VOC family protein [Galbitalea sp.]